MIKQPLVPLSDMIMCLSDVVDLVSPAVANHHKQVAYIASTLGAELGLPAERQRELVLAGAVHDIGAISVRERMGALQFEVDTPSQHTELGYSLLKTFVPLVKVADLVRFHHTHWNQGNCAKAPCQPVSIGAHILHLADRVAALLNKQQEVLGQARAICDRIAEQSGRMFMPELVYAFTRLAEKEYFWLDVTSPTLGSILRRQLRSETLELDMDGLVDFAALLSRIIDFRSPFTATHSSGVAASAESLARLVGFSESECKMMRFAGCLHDLGKLAVPTEILEKPARLTEDEFNIVRRHTFYTYRALEHIDDISTVNCWASFHHERMDGKGYPFHIKGQDLLLGSRIMAVADVFTAITEDRPYREAMPNDRALQTLQQMADDSILDSHMVSLLKLHFDEINSLRMAAQATKRLAYDEIMNDLDVANRRGNDNPAWLAFNCGSQSTTALGGGVEITSDGGLGEQSRLLQVGGN